MLNSIRYPGIIKTVYLFPSNMKQMLVTRKLFSVLSRCSNLFIRKELKCLSNKRSDRNTSGTTRTRVVMLYLNRMNFKERIMLEKSSKLKCKLTYTPSGHERGHNRSVRFHDLKKYPLFGDVQKRHSVTGGLGRA